MNNKTITYHLLLLLSALMLPSCSQEDMPAVEEKADNAKIFFRVSFPEADARSSDVTVVDKLKDGFHVTAFCPEDENPQNPYFEEQSAKPLEDMPGCFGILDQSDDELYWPSIRHDKTGKLKFFAFYPSREALRQSAGVADGFVLENKSAKQGTAVKYDYRIKKFKVLKDITRHIDFVTATNESSLKDLMNTGNTDVSLAFEHQLCRIILKAWGNTGNDIEIAGVRIGGVVVESDFNFAATPRLYAKGDATANCDWVTPQVKDCVEYIFREGDVVVKVGDVKYKKDGSIESGNHFTANSAVSIMGKGGWAMVIPAAQDYKGWNHTSDAPNKNKGLYFSVLLRVKEANDKKTLVYPYILGGSLSGNVTTDAMTMIFMAIDKTSGKVLKKVYRNSDDNKNKYYTDAAYTEEYTCSENAEIRHYGWAAIPLSKFQTSYRWKPGYQYTYTLDYSAGVGVHDPADPFPGKPILSKVMVEVSEKKEEPWPRVNGFVSGPSEDVTNKIKVE